MAESRRIIFTSDGSPTIWDPLFKESFHSRFGAIQESEWIFIGAGLNYLLRSGREEVKILEIGMGSGLNVLLTIKALKSLNVSLLYDAVELFPLDEELYSSLDFDLVSLSGIFKLIHESRWGEWVTLEKDRKLRKLNADASRYEFPNNTYNLIYYDAFSPESQPEMWSPEMFKKIAESMEPGAIFVTYSSKGEVRRRLQESGLKVERLPGPEGKRHIIRAVKPTDDSQFTPQ